VDQRVKQFHSGVGAKHAVRPDDEAAINTDG
jgi:hypothetical protein